MVTACSRPLRTCITKLCACVTGIQEEHASLLPAVAPLALLIICTGRLVTDMVAAGLRPRSGLQCRRGYGLHIFNFEEQPSGGLFVRVKTARCWPQCGTGATWWRASSQFWCPWPPVCPKRHSVNQRRARGLPKSDRGIPGLNKNCLLLPCQGLMQDERARPHAARQPKACTPHTTRRSHVTQHYY